MSKNRSDLRSGAKPQICQGCLLATISEILRSCDDNFRIFYKLAMFPTIVRRATTKPGFDIATNPYKAKRVWPPDFEKLPPKYQFRLERRYRRRTKLKWARPRWTKAIKLAQSGSVMCERVPVSMAEAVTNFLHSVILTYGILFMDWGTEETPFKGVCSTLQRFGGLHC